MTDSNLAGIFVKLTDSLYYNLTGHIAVLKIEGYAETDATRDLQAPD